MSRSTCSGRRPDPTGWTKARLPHWTSRARMSLVLSTGYALTQRGPGCTPAPTGLHQLQPGSWVRPTQVEYDHGTAADNWGNPEQPGILTVTRSRPKLASFDDLAAGIVGMALDCSAEGVLPQTFPFRGSQNHSLRCAWKMSRSVAIRFQGKRLPPAEELADSIPRLGVRVSLASLELSVLLAVTSGRHATCLTVNPALAIVLKQ